ncbi:hypothetical protein ACOME3_010263 [Neoechinorhynchus agilis]
MCEDVPRFVIRNVLFRSSPGTQPGSRRLLSNTLLITIDFLYCVCVQSIYGDCEILPLTGEMSFGIPFYNKCSNINYFQLKVVNNQLILVLSRQYLFQKVFVKVRYPIF